MATQADNAFPMISAQVGVPLASWGSSHQNLSRVILNMMEGSQLHNVLVLRFDGAKDPIAELCHPIPQWFPQRPETVRGDMD